MPDQATIDSVATKFEAWAESLSDEEQATVAEWLTLVSDEVRAHTSTMWWKEPDAWRQAWSEAWSHS